MRYVEKTKYPCSVACPFCEDNRRRGKPVFEGPGYCPERLENWRMSIDARFRRTVSTDHNSGTEPAAEDSAFAKQYPTLASYLTEKVWEDTKERRETSSLMIFCEDGLWKAMINDRDSKHVAFVSKTSFKGLFEALEKGLQLGTLDWRKSRDNGPKKKS